MDDFKENLKRLFGNDAEKAFEDICQGDILLGSFTSPKPAPQVVADIKTKISSQLSRNRRYRLVRKISAAAAAVFVIAALWASTYAPKQESMDMVALHESYSVQNEWKLGEDAEYAMILNEIENLESRVSNIMLNEDNFEYGSVGYIEMDMVDIDEAFWKG